MYDIKKIENIISSQFAFKHTVVALKKRITLCMLA